MKSIIFGAGSDLGVHIDGAHLGPIQLAQDLKSFYKGEIINLNQNENIIKSRNLSDRRKNEYELEEFNTKLYNTIIEKTKDEKLFPITVGGDKSVCIASSLANASKYPQDNIGMIWFSSHADYNTFESTVTGNIAGLSVAAINGYKNHELRYFHKTNVIQTAKTVIIGARDIEENEKDNIKYSGIKIYTTKDIKERGIEEILNEAFQIVTTRTKGVHISYCLDLFDPDVAPGVSIPKFDGLTEEEGMKINEEVLKHIDDILSYDLVGFNPLRDQNRKTEQIALNMLVQVINAATNKGKTFNRKY